MRTKTPPNIDFIVKSHALGARAGGGGRKNIPRYQFVCIIRCKQKVGEKNNTIVQIIAHNSTTTNIYLSRYVYSNCIIFVFLRLCSSHQLL